MARETACLSLEDRQTVDVEIAGNAGNAERFEATADGELVAEIRKIAYRLDPHSVVARRRKAERERRVALRPAPDVMSQLSALLPVKDGVAVHAVLTREADRPRAVDDDRSRGQIMADTLVQRILSADPRDRDPARSDDQPRRQRPGAARRQRRVGVRRGVRPDPRRPGS